MESEEVLKLIWNNGDSLIKFSNFSFHVSRKLGQLSINDFPSLEIGNPACKINFDALTEIQLFNGSTSYCSSQMKHLKCISKSSKSRILIKELIHGRGLFSNWACSDLEKITKRLDGL